MRSGRIGGIGLFLLLAIASAAPVRADGPGPDLKLLADETFKSPDNALSIEQYSKDLGDDGFNYQFWVFDKDHQNASLLNGGEDEDLARYPAGLLPGECRRTATTSTISRRTS